jgi:hypothetical protein
MPTIGPELLIPFLIGEEEPEPPPEPVSVPKKAVVSPFSYYAFDFLTGAFQGQVPLRGVTFGKQLNSPGTLKGTLDLSDPRVQATFPLQNTIPNKSYIVADYMGQALWGGIVLPREPKTESSGSSTTGTLEITCSETWAYFQHRVQATDYSSPPYNGIAGHTGLPLESEKMALWTATPFDASLIACQIIEDVLGYADGMSFAHGNPLGGMAVMLNGAVPSLPVASPTDWIAVSYPYPSMQLVDTIVNQLAQLGLEVGFDYAVDIAYSAGSPSPPVGTVNLSYPRRGRTVEQNSLLIDVTTARGYLFPEQGSETGNRAIELGGTGAISVSENTFAQEQGYAIWERLYSRANIQSQNITKILAQTGESDLAVNSYAPVTPSITLGINDPNLPLGSFVEGEDVQVLIPATIELGGESVVFDPRFPAGMDQEWRITGYNVEVLDQGDALVKLALAAPPFTQALSPSI